MVGQIPTPRRPPGRRSAEVAAFQGVADQVYSVAIGAGGSGSSNPDLVLMRSLAKPDDDSHSFHVVDASALPDIFRQIAVELLNPHSHLIQVYPAPVVTAVGGGTTVNITGKYFTGAERVTFGGDVSFVHHQQRYVDHRDGAKWTRRAKPSTFA